MQNARYIIIKINNNNIGYSVIDCTSMTFFYYNGNILKSIDLSMMLEEIIDIPSYIKILLEKDIDNSGYVMESSSANLSNFYQNLFPHSIIPNKIMRYANPEILSEFDLNDDGLFFRIQVIPQPIGLYYGFTIIDYDRLVVDIIVNPADMLFVDEENGYIHTMEQGYVKKAYSQLEIIKFINPDIEITDIRNTNDKLIFI